MKQKNRYGKNPDLFPPFSFPALLFGKSMVK